MQHSYDFLGLGLGLHMGYLRSGVVMDAASEFFYMMIQPPALLTTLIYLFHWLDPF